MRILNWNIDEGGRPGMVKKIVEISLATAPDAIVLPEYRKDKPQIKNQLVMLGFKQHIPTVGYKTGNQVAIFTRKELGFETEESIRIPQLDGVTVFCKNGLWTIGGVFFPKKAKGTPSIHPFIDWLTEDPLKLSERPTVMTGDFNHGVQAAAWNKGKTGSEYGLLRRWVKKGTWIDCCPEPNLNRAYLIPNPLSHPPIHESL